MGQQSLISRVFRLAKRLLRVEHVELRGTAKPIVRFRHFSRAARLGDVQLGGLNNALRDRQRVPRRLHVEPHLILERT